MKTFYQNQLIAEANQQIEEDDGNTLDWFSSATQRREKQERKRTAQKQLDKIIQQENKIKNLRKIKKQVKSFAIQCELIFILLLQR